MSALKPTGRLISLVLLLVSWLWLLVTHHQHSTRTSRPVSVTDKNTGLNERLLLHENTYDLPPFHMRIKIVDTYKHNEDLDFYQDFQKELENVVTEHLASVVHDEFPGIPVTLEAHLVKTQHSDKEAIMQANFTGSVSFMDTVTPYSQSLMFALLKRAFLTKEEYTHLVDRLHQAPNLPIIRGVKVSLAPTTTTLQQQSPTNAEKINIHSSSSASLHQDPFRLVAFLSMGALLSICLFFVDFMTRPKRKNWKPNSNKTSKDSGHSPRRSALDILLGKNGNSYRRGSPTRLYTNGTTLHNNHSRLRSRSFDKDTETLKSSMSSSPRRTVRSSSNDLVPLRRKNSLGRSNSFDPSTHSPYRTNKQTAMEVMNTSRRGRRSGAVVRRNSNNSIGLVVPTGS